jgi:hypothetical protein
VRKACLVAVLVVCASSAIAAPSLTRITPNEAFSFGPTLVTLEGNELSPQFVRCDDFSPCPVRVWFGQVEGKVMSASSGRITAEAPAQSDGVTVDVRVLLADGTELLLPQALSYRYMANAGRENFVRYLVPITSRNQPGAHGSLWSSELVLHNRSAVGLWLETVRCSPSTACPPPAIYVEPGQTRVVTELDSGVSEGRFLSVPRPLSTHVDFQLRARDLSRENEGWGAEVPVVPQDAFRAPDGSGADFEIRLLNIPVDPRYRVTLRVYSEQTDPTFGFNVELRTHAQSDGRLLEMRLIHLPPMAAMLAQTGVPAYAQLDPFTEVVRASGEERVVLKLVPQSLIFVTPPTYPPIWAFASITNNVTQEVTVVTPHRP